MKIRLELCPICGKEIDIENDITGPEDWKPTFYDPDSGGEPYELRCQCGLTFCTGDYDFPEFARKWNKRYDQLPDTKVFYVAHVEKRKVCKLVVDTFKRFADTGNKTAHGYIYGLYGTYGVPTEYSLNHLNKRIIFVKKKDATMWLEKQISHNVMKEYTQNPDFRQYVDKYCQKHKITPEEAVQHKLVQFVEAEYRHKRVDCK